MSDFINIAVVCAGPRRFQDFCDEMRLSIVYGYINNLATNICIAGYVKYIMISTLEQARGQVFASAIYYGRVSEWNELNNLIKLINQRLQCPK